jgi:hypothetical protein
MPYRTTYARRPVQRTGPRANKFDGGCSRCGRLVPAGTGVLTGNRDQGYEIRHGDRTWQGSPVSGRWAGGCEGAADMPVYEAKPAVRHGYTSGGARMTSRYGRCEDAPCCGCCD